MGYAIYVKTTLNNPVEDFMFNLKGKEVARTFKPAINKLNKVDNSVESEDGIIKLGEVSFQKNSTVILGRQEKGTSMIVNYTFIPKRSGIKIGTTFDKLVKVYQMNQDGTEKEAESAVFFGGGIDQSVIDKVNRGAELVKEDEVGKPIDLAFAFYVPEGDWVLRFGGINTPYKVE